MRRIRSQPYACGHKVELGRMPDIPNCRGVCEGLNAQDEVLSVCAPCGLANFSSAVRNIDRVKPATTGRVDTSDKTQALPQFLFPVAFPGSPPLQTAVLVPLAPAAVHPVASAPLALARWLLLLPLLWLPPSTPR